MQAKLSDIVGYLNQYILKSRKKNNSRLHFFRDKTFSEVQIEIAKEFIRTLYKITEPKGYYHRKQICREIYAAIIAAEKTLRDTILAVENGNSDYSDGGHISLNSSFSLTIETLEQKLEEGNAGTLLYFIFNFLKNNLKAVELDIGFFDNKGSIAYVSDPNPFITNKML